MNAQNSLKRLNNKEFFSRWVNVIAIVLMLVAFTAINNRFLSPLNICNILSDVSTLLVFSVGMTFMILIGSIDLSVGFLSSAMAVIFVMTLPTMGALSYPLILLLGIAAGCISGILTVVVKIPSFIATFGMMGIWRSLAMIVAKGASQQIPREYIGLIKWYRVKIAGFIPLVFIVALVIFFIMLLVERRTKFGKTVFAIGGNELAARMCGLNIVLTKIIVFSLNGLLAAVAGIIFASKMKSGIPAIGEPFNLMTIAAVILGGTSMSGGMGGMVKTIAGVLLIILIQNGMNIIGISAFWQQAMFGMIILAAVYLTTDRSRLKAIIK